LVGGNAKGTRRDGDDDEIGGWWAGWLTSGVGGSGLNALGTNLAHNEERLEDRMTRSWGGRMNSGFGGALDDWAI
jgi:hypothetical protein